MKQYMHHARLLYKTYRENEYLMVKALIDIWNAETPHFGGCGPHRYDGKSTKCAYCNRPKNWINKPSTFFADTVLETK